uniref:LIM zinc-binding domain-containing protein n=1 Tax=Periophthalmus magnuspinnatus TaxID=409849 RepID=A0A3B4ARY1_9GOBI
MRKHMQIKKSLFFLLRELCTVCRRRAYPMDALIVDKKKYHKSCFRCEHCRNRLSVGNYVSLHGHFYCLHHYKQLLKSKGNYDNGLVQESSDTKVGFVFYFLYLKKHCLIGYLDFIRCYRFKGFTVIKKDSYTWHILPR